MKARKLKAKLIAFVTSARLAPLVFPGISLKTDKEVLWAVKRALSKLAAPVSDEPALDEQFALKNTPPDPDDDDDEDMDDPDDDGKMVSRKTKPARSSLYEPYVALMHGRRFELLVDPNLYYLRALSPRELKKDQAGVAVMRKATCNAKSKILGRVLVGVVEGKLSVVALRYAPDKNNVIGTVHGTLVPNPRVTEALCEAVQSGLTQVINFAEMCA